MIKHLAKLLLATSLLINLSACKETDPQINDKNNEKMRLELKEAYPSLNNAQIRIEVKDFQDITIMLGDKQLYRESDEQLKEVTNVIANMVYDIYNENNYLDEGKVIFLEKEREEFTKDDPRKEYDMHLEEIIKQKENNE